jgi:hypothetical protein
LSLQSQLDCLQSVLIVLRFVFSHGYKLFLGTKNNPRTFLILLQNFQSRFPPQKVAQGNGATKKVFQEKVGETFIQKRNFPILSKPSLD